MRLFMAAVACFGLSASGVASAQADNTAAAVPDQTVPPGIEAAIDGFMQRATPPALTTAPGGDPHRVAPVVLPAARGITAKATSCEAKEAERVAGLIASYACASVGVAAPSAAVTFPTECTSNAGLGTSGWIAVSRKAACTHTVLLVTVTEIPSGRILGTSSVHAINTMESVNGSTNQNGRWTSTSFMFVPVATGNGSPTSVSGRLAPSCGGCTTSDNTWAPRTFATWGGSGNLESNVLGAGTVQNNVSGQWQYTLSGAGWGNSISWNPGLPATRCDNAQRGRNAGCVLPTIPAVVGFDTVELPTYTQHVALAQLSGLPGGYGTTSYLTRLTDSALRLQNGNKACPAGNPPRPVGFTCDEYPFRSTYQGASTSGAQEARSFTGCQMPDPQRNGPNGWSRCFIPASENSLGGQRLGSFYGDERILDGERFQVGFIL